MTYVTKLLQETCIESVHEGLKNYKAFCLVGKLKKHIQCVHEKLRTHKCDLCNKAFSFKFNLKKHIRKFHGGMKKHNRTVTNLCTLKQNYVQICFRK